MTTTLPPRAGRHCHAAVNPLHSTLYFSPDFTEALAGLGVKDPNAAYFAGRSAAMGAVGPGTVTATFYNFSYGLVSRHLPRIWSVVTPDQVLDARLRAAGSTLRRLLGEKALASPEMAEAAELALRAAEACARPGRPLYAAHADLPVPDEPHLAFWHAATLLREHRGDGHIMVLQQAGLGALEALVTHSASGRGMTPKWVRASRGWTPADWSGAEDRLRERGLLDERGELTEEGVSLRKELEERTDALDSAPYEHLGAEGTLRLTELAGAFAAAALEAGAFPASAFGKG
ncbi:SCO6745 family protein [Streptomyces sp. GC420]|uniref:SCO6745 family protein n=1 Tax=Streptomyces sp. GC420 TaxID=2697568 RepID=UPI001415279A|nr:hypothetical protein [Streptomyces sp. GC420]NBM18365.1 hypothetical protein [Streptomyces sp. GC420]